MSTFSIDDVIVGESRPIRQLRERVTQLATARVPVLIQGPTGSGKELVAEALHRLSGRPGSLVAVNVCAVAESMFEDAFFGHVKGAFSGAVRDAAGFLGEAHRGSLFLDEVGSLTRAAQPKLLRAIELGRYRPVGGSSDRSSEFRVIAAANEDLEALVEAGHFRFDLLQRLKATIIRVPALDERPEDIPLLVRTFLARTSGFASPARFTDDALRMLEERAWPGSVRELKNLVESVLVIAREGIIGPCDIESIAPPSGLRPRHMPLGASRGELLGLLAKSGWDVQSVADVLGVHRVTLWRWMRRFGIARPRSALRADLAAVEARAAP